MDLDRPRLLLLKLIADSDTTDVAVSRAIGRNHAYIHQYVKAGKPRHLPEEVREALAQHFAEHHVSADEFRHDWPQAQPRPAAAPPAVARGMMVIDELDVRAANAASGVIHPREGDDAHEAVVHRWQVPSNLVRNYTAAPADRLKIITAIGDSNVPQILPGERIMVDTSDRKPSPAGFFAIWDGFGEIIKRLEMIPYSEPPRVLLMSVNPAYPTRELELQQVVINGRVIGKWLFT